MRLRMGVVLLGLAACGNATNSSRPAPASVAGPAVTADAVALSAQYLALVTPVNTALDTFKSKMASLPSTATVKDLPPITAPVGQALTTFDSAALRLAWPPSMTADVHALVAMDAAAVGDLDGVGAVTVLNSSTWVQQVVSDLNKAGSASNVVRADLGLPPPSP